MSDRTRLTAILPIVALGVVMVLPMLWILALSLKSNAALMADTASVFQAPWTLKNYAAIFGGSSVFRWLLNSTIVAIGVTAGVLILSSLAGYAFARLEFPGRDILFIFVLAGLAIPDQAVILARHQIFSALHLHNTFPGLILPGLAAPFGVFLMTQYFRAIPRDLDEAAALDGAGGLKILTRIILPLSFPAQATLGIFTFISVWNDYWWPLISATRQDMFTLTVGIASQQMNFAQTEGLGFLMAQAVFAGLPMLLLYIVFQKHIVQAVAGAAGR